MKIKTNKKIETSSEVKKEKKRVNPTWEAIQRDYPILSYAAPEMFD
ncbi:MAG: hypothetical protein J6Y51_07190 [Bacteroidaceae bacterium]|nr:hypothetical protein [Bacteroidaceae bacterium]